MLHSINLITSHLLNTGYKRVIFALVSGLALALTLPYFGFGFYVWIGLIPLLILIKSSESYLGSLFDSFLFLLTYNLVSFSWLFALHPLDWQGLSNFESIIVSSLAWLIPSFSHSLILLPFVLAVKFFYEYRTNERSNELRSFDIALLAFIWVAIEYKLLFKLDIVSVPINFLAYSQFENKALIQVSNIIGSVGLEYFIVLTNLTLSNFFNIHKLRTSDFGGFSKFNVQNPFFGLDKVQEHSKLTVAILVITLGFYTYGLVEINRKNNEKEIQIALVQPDFSVAKIRGTSAKPQNLIALQNTLVSKIKERKDILFWTEGAIPYIDKSNLDTIKAAYQVADIFIYGTYNKEKSKLYNSIDFVEYQFQTKNTDSKLYTEKLNPEQALEFSQISEINNDQLFVKESNRTSYHKHRLVPFGEYTPFLNLLPMPLKLLAQSTVGSGFNTGKLSKEPMRLLRAKIASSICFELLFPKLISNQVNNGGEFIINLNDLSWFKGQDGSLFNNKILLKQFLAVATFRAIENKRDLVLAGNSGYSAIIDAHGQTQKKTDANKIAVLQGSITTRKEKSLYSKYGW